MSKDSLYYNNHYQIMEKKSRRKNKQVGRWSRQEHTRFIQAIMDHGKNWKVIQEIVKTRTIAQVRSHAQKFFNRLTKTQKSILLPFEGEYQEDLIDKKESLQIQNQDNEEKDQEQPKQKLLSINDVQNDESSSSQESQQQDEERTPEQDPAHLVSMIKKQSNDGKTKVQVKTFIRRLNSQSSSLCQSIMQKKSSQKSQNVCDLQRSKHQMDNLGSLLIAYITLSESQESHEQSFFLSLLRKYRKFIYRNNFLRLVDLPLKEQTQKYQIGQRKKSFNLTQNREQFLQSQNKQTMSVEKNCRSN